MKSQKRTFRNTNSTVLISLLLVGLLPACGGKSSNGDGVDAAVDAGEPDAGPRECIMPEVQCADGEHNEYGLCVLDAEEVGIPAGTFDMGAPSGTEFPLHSVNISLFHLDRYEITNERYQACMDAGCCDPPTYDGSYSGRQPYFRNPDFAQYPVIFVTWEMANQYCYGLGKRLPTEAEWEYAARGNDGRMYPWGSEPPDTQRANFDMPRDGDTGPVGAHLLGVSPFGIQDMAGNVWEWVNDWHDPDYYNQSPLDDPPGPETGAAKVVRGGSFASAATLLYAFYRGSYLPRESFSNVGFRCAK